MLSGLSFSHGWLRHGVGALHHHLLWANWYLLSWLSVNHVVVLLRLGNRNLLALLCLWNLLTVDLDLLLLGMLLLSIPLLLLGLLLTRSRSLASHSVLILHGVQIVKKKIERLTRQKLGKLHDSSLVLHGSGGLLMLEESGAINLFNQMSLTSLLWFKLTSVETLTFELVLRYFVACFLGSF